MALHFVTGPSPAVLDKLSDDLKAQGRTVVEAASLLTKSGKVNKRKHAMLRHQSADQETFVIGSSSLKPSEWPHFDSKTVASKRPSVIPEFRQSQSPTSQSQRDWEASLVAAYVLQGAAVIDATSPVKLADQVLEIAEATEEMVAIEALSQRQTSRGGLVLITGKSARTLDLVFKRIAMFGLPTVDLSDQQTSNTKLRRLEKSAGPRTLFVRGPKELAQSPAFSAVTYLGDPASADVPDNGVTPVHFEPENAKVEDIVRSTIGAMKDFATDLSRALDRGLPA